MGVIIAFVIGNWPWLLPIVGGLGAAVPFAGPIMAFSLANWRWLLPALAIAGLGIDDGRLRFKVDRLELAAEKAANTQLEIVAAAEAEVRRKMTADVEYGGKLAGEYAAESAKLQGDLQDALVRLAKADHRQVCDHSPAADAYDNWLRNSDPAGGAAVPQPDGRPRTQVPVPARGPGPRRVP